MSNLERKTENEFDNRSTAAMAWLDGSLEVTDRPVLVDAQLGKFRAILDPILSGNDFYRRKLMASGLSDSRDIQEMDDLQKLPFTTKEELAIDQASALPYGSNLTYAREKYTRIHQTSGTKGVPLKWLDTDESWKWWAHCWAAVYRAAGVTRHDRVFFAFSFGPFIGFWTAHSGAQEIGAMAVTGGGMSSFQRAKAILDHEVTVLVSTPTYALHLMEVAEAEGINLAASDVRLTIHAGEPGASLPGTKERIQKAWQARCFDHAGATEVGAWGFDCGVQRGLHVNEAEFICEVIDPETLKPANEGELVLTNLGRTGSPVIRYRTGDRVSISKSPCECGRSFIHFDGGIIGRIDDVIIVRGVNIYPSAIESVIRRFPEIGEYAVDIYRRKQLDDFEIRFEVKPGSDSESISTSLSKELRATLGVLAQTNLVPFGTLPRFDLKARRVSQHR